jgi:hypothetical protein
MAKNYVTIRTPKGKSLWAHLITPDDKFNKLEYKTTLLFDPDTDEFKAFAQKIDGFMEEAEGIAKKASKGKKIVRKDWYEPHMIADSDENYVDSGLVAVKFKAGAITAKQTKRVLSFFDAKGKPIEDTSGLQIWNGSELKLMAHPSPYHAPGFGNIYGVTLYIEKVQIIELVSGGADSDFEDEGGSFTSDDLVGSRFDSDGETDGDY